MASKKNSSKRQRKESQEEAQLQLDFLEAVEEEKKKEKQEEEEEEEKQKQRQEEEEEKKKQKQKEEEEKEKEENGTYVSNCCKNKGLISKGLIRFLVTSFFTLLLITFAMFKLSVGSNDSSEQALYYSLLASCVAIYLPAPSPHDRT
jgi:cation transport ATPase